MRVFQIGLLFIFSITDSRDMCTEISETADSARKIFPYEISKTGHKISC